MFGDSPTPQAAVPDVGEGSPSSIGPKIWNLQKLVMNQALRTLTVLNRMSGNPPIGGTGAVCRWCHHSERERPGEGADQEDQVLQRVFHSNILDQTLFVDSRGQASTTRRTRLSSNRNSLVTK